MKLDDEAKPEDSQSQPGEYSTDELDQMLEHFVQAKTIEADPKKLAMLKDYAMSKSKQTAELFDVNNLPAPKSLKDLKKTYDRKVKDTSDDEG